MNMKRAIFIGSGIGCGIGMLIVAYIAYLHLDDWPTSRRLPVMGYIILLGVAGRLCFDRAR